MRLRVVISILIFVVLSTSAMSQSVRTGVFMLDELQFNNFSTPINGIYMPPNLKVDIEFVDSDGRGVLSALEEAVVRLAIKNFGGDAKGVRVTFMPEMDYPGIILKENTKNLDVMSGETTIVEFPLQAGIDVSTNKDTKFGIKIYEPLGYDIEAVLTLPTLEYLKPKLILNGVASIADAGVGLMARNGNPDGRVQAGDVVSVSVLLQNIGVGNAADVTYTITSNDSNVLLYTATGPVKRLTGKLDEMLSGEVKEISFRVSPTNRYDNTSEYLPIFITLQESTGLGDLISHNIPIPFDAAHIEPEIVSVDADVDRLFADIGRSVVTSEDSRVNINSQQIRDINVVPKGTELYKDAVAVVIGAENFADKSIPTAPYSSRDAEIMSDYFKISMGVGNVVLLTDEEVTSIALNTTFDGQRGRLSKLVQPDVTDVFVYFSGHGVPMDTENGERDVFLVPYDVGKSWIKDYGFSLNEMYSDLASLKAKSVTVIMDACFSGGSRPSAMYKSESVANQKLVITDFAEMEKPWLENDNFRVFTSSRGDQTSQGRDLSRSGLFTYYIAIGLQGDADADKDGSITMAELVGFVTENVHNESNGEQTPQFYGNYDFVLEQIK